MNVQPEIPPVHEADEDLLVGDPVAPDHGLDIGLFVDEPDDN